MRDIADHLVHVDGLDTNGPILRLECVDTTKCAMEYDHGECNTKLWWDDSGPGMIGASQTISGPPPWPVKTALESDYVVLHAAMGEN